MVRTHYLKCWPEMFNAIERGEKTAEFRPDNRYFALFDLIVFRCWDPSEDKARSQSSDPMGWAWKNSTFSTTQFPMTEEERQGHVEVIREITHIVRGPHFGIPEGYVMMSLGGVPVAAFAITIPDLGPE